MALSRGSRRETRSGCGLGNGSGIILNSSFSFISGHVCQWLSIPIAIKLMRLILDRSTDYFEIGNDGTLVSTSHMSLAQKMSIVNACHIKRQQIPGERYIYLAR